MEPNKTDNTDALDAFNAAINETEKEPVIIAEPKKESSNEFESKTSFLAEEEEPVKETNNKENSPQDDSDYISFEEQSHTTKDMGNSDRISNDEFIHILLDAGLIIIILDFLMPGVCMAICKKFKYKIDKRSLKLTQTEKNDLEPYLQKWIDATNFKFLKPWHVAVISIVSVYAGKIMSSNLEKTDD